MLSEFLKSHADAIGNGLLVIVMAFLSAVGVRGMRRVGSETPPPETVAVTSDVSVVLSLKALTAEMGALNVNLIAHRKLLEEHAKSIELNGEAAEHLKDAATALALEMRLLADATNRGGPPRGR